MQLPFCSVMLSRQSFMPAFFLEGAGHPHLNQEDGNHPTEEGYASIVDTVWKVLEPML
jgi:lysophospholipase L1-like esterase